MVIVAVDPSYKNVFSYGNLTYSVLMKETVGVIDGVNDGVFVLVGDIEIVGEIVGV